MSEHPRIEILVDAHVHLHPCFEVVPFLEAAHKNFGRFASTTKTSLGVLCLTEGPDEGAFDRLLNLRHQQQMGDANLGPWQLLSTLEPTSLYLLRDGKPALLILAGRQIRTSENLEVLALGTLEPFEDGRVLETTLEAVVQTGALAVIPWGLGKWRGARGKHLEALITHPDPPVFFLGDNANRPTRWPRPAFFALAEAQGITNLPGSDPLPFPAEYRHPGRAGVILEAALDTELPGHSLMTLLMAPTTAVRPFGRYEKPARFIRNQLAMQYRKWTKRRNPTPA